MKYDNEYHNPDGFIAQYLSTITVKPKTREELMRCIQSAVTTAFEEHPSTRMKSTNEYRFFVVEWSTNYMADLAYFLYSCMFYSGKSIDWPEYYLYDTVNYHRFIYILNLFHSMRTIGLNLNLASAAKDLEDFRRDDS